MTGISSVTQVASSCTFMIRLPSPARQTTVLVGTGDLGADRRRQAEAHRPEAAGVDPATRLVEAVVLRGPHLVLADVGGDDRVALGRPVHRLDHELGLDLAVLAGLVDERVLLLPAAQLLPPGVEPGAVGLQRPVLAGQLRQHLLDVADDRDVGADVLGDLRRVDVDVDDLGVRRELGQLAGDPVVEAGADRDDQVGVVHRRSWRCGCRACPASRASSRRRPGRRRGPSGSR